MDQNSQNDVLISNYRIERDFNVISEFLGYFTISKMHIIFHKSIGKLEAEHYFLIWVAVSTY